MPSQLTTQINTDGGTDTSSSTRAVTGSSRSVKSGSASSTGSDTEKSNDTSVRKVKPSRQTTVEDAGIATQKSAEDNAFNISFKIVLKGSVGCEYYPKEIPDC